MLATAIPSVCYFMSPISVQSLQFEMEISLKLYLLLRCHVMQPKDPVVDSRLSREACPELLKTFVIPEIFVHSHPTL